MLEPRKDDLPVLFLVLVVLPLVTYILLGKWSEAAQKKARISGLAQLAAEEAFRVEDVIPFPDTVPVPASPKAGFNECAKCFAPATTRCSRCKSVRYCSGRCQIIHWRQGHRQECRDWQNNNQYSFPSRNSVPHWSYTDNSKQFYGNDIDETLHSDIFSDQDSDISFTTTDTSHPSSSSESKLPYSDNRVYNKPKTGNSKSVGTVASAFESNMNFASGFPNKYGKTLLTNIPSKETPLVHKFGNRSFISSIEGHKHEGSNNSVYGHSAAVLRNATYQSDILTSETTNIHGSSHSFGNSEYIIPNETGLQFASDEGFSSFSEILDHNFLAEEISVRESIMFKRPPYTLTEEKVPKDYRSIGLERMTYMDNESRISSTNVSTSKSLQNNNGMESTIISKKACNKNKVVFPYEDLVKYFQCNIWGISPRGMINCGNSCYANAVLQCLTCTKPLIVYLLRRTHSKTCRIRDWCLMCELEHHVSMLREGGGPLSPSRILSNMRNIGCRMGGGNQEDAHEYLRLLVMSMQSICLESVGGEKKVYPESQETTLIQQIFGGRLKSKVKCLRCHAESERYEHIMDLTLEIHGWVESLEDALTQFTAPEDLDGENKYRCGRCSAYVKARKQLSVCEVPNILTIVLKRFQSGRYGKINKCVTFPEMLDMIPFVSENADSPPLYMLYGVIVHLDNQNASFSGHYISYVKDVQGTWFKTDDSEVHVVSLNEVMSQGAYMLFYSRSFPRPPKAYNEKAPKAQKISRNGHNKPSEPNNSRRSKVLPRDKMLSMDFHDATSSDCSLFTSSDDSSFTTESARDSFSTVDHGEPSGLDPISSIFAPPFYPDYPNNSISCTEFSPSRPRTRFFSENSGFDLDSSLPLPTNPPRNVHKGRDFEQTEDPPYSGDSCNAYVQYRTNPNEDFVQDSGDWVL